MEKETFPDGFFFREKDHTYALNGSEMTGVTSVLDSVGSPGGLMQYAANFAASKALETPLPEGFVEARDALIKEYGKLSSDVARALDKNFPEWKEARTAHAKNTKKRGTEGTDSHLLAEKWENREEVPSTPELEQYIKWYKQNVAWTYFTERPLFSREWFIGGTPDGGFRTKDGKNLIDDKKFKDSIFDNKPHWQMAVYRKMIEEMRADTTTPIRIEWENGTIEEYKNPQEYLNTFSFVQWDGSVVLAINKEKCEPLYRFAYEEDLDSFESALKI